MNNPALKGEVSIDKMLKKYGNNKKSAMSCSIPFKDYKLTELNLMEDGDSSPNLKIWVSSG